MSEIDTLNANVLRELECPICTDYMTPPIRLCETGHSICESCVMKLPKCPLCQKYFIRYAKNLCLQALLYEVRYPCTNQAFGCDEKLKLDQKESHVKKCLFRGYKCAIEKCDWTGPLAAIKDHWIICSNSRELQCAKINVVASMASAVTYSNFADLSYAFDHFFWMKHKVHKGAVYWTVQLLGDADEANNYCYEIEVYDSNNTLRRIILKDYCKSIDIKDNDLLNADTCFTSIGRVCRKHLLNIDQTLSYTVQIYEV